MKARAGHDLPAMIVASSSRSRPAWRRAAAAALCLLLLVPASVLADALSIVVTGVKQTLASNIEAHVGGQWVSGVALSSPVRRKKFIDAAIGRAALALRPYGYYVPDIDARLVAGQEQDWRLELEVRPGPAVTVRELTLDIKGEGMALESVRAWRDAWPLETGKRLMQPLWDSQKRTVLGMLDEQGYLSAHFEQSQIRLDLDAHRADLVLVLDTGPRAVMGEVRFEQDLLRDSVLTPLPRFRAGDPYRVALVDNLRTDLWRSGYWEVIDVTEERLLDQEPQLVNLVVALEPTEPNTHQGTIGFGTDTEFRTQYRFQRHYLSGRGDALNAGFGWQSRNEELFLFSEYRLPRRVRSHEYWQINPVLKRESQDVDVNFEGETDTFRLATGRIDDATVRFGRVKLRNLGDSRQQLIETVYAQYLREDDSFELAPQNRLVQGVAVDGDSTDMLFGISRFSVALGLEWDWPVVQGSGFGLRGHRERAWIFTANEAWGSEVQYSQVYLSSRWEIPLGERGKLLLRGEAGWSDARVDELELDLEGRILQLSITELPFLYRFKAGGSQSVRGYDYETLSSNGIGSNHLLTGSVEYEHLLVGDWSGAVFYDIGNAFNDWSQTSLKRGMGAGLRWYTRIGVLRLDLAQARDLDGHPWRFHLTIGSPLL